MKRSEMLHFVVWIATLLVVGRDAAIPEYIHVCKAGDSDISKCIRNSVENLKPQLQKGITELNVPPMEPLHLDEIILRRGPTSTRISANITNIKVWGASNFEIIELRANIPKNRFFFKVKIPYLYFEGQYELDMQILLVNLKGKGSITGNFSDYECDAVMIGNKVERDGEQYLNFDKIKIRISMGKSKLHLESLLGGDPLLGRVSNEVLNENADVFLNEIKPNLESSLAEKLTEIANKITLRFTYKELFP